MTVKWWSPRAPVVGAGSWCRLLGVGVGGVGGRLLMVGGATRFDLRLGESIHIDGMGAVTLLEVEPAPLSGSNVPGGPSGAVVNISFAPGVSECWFGNSVKISLLGGWGLLSEWPLVDWARLG